MTNLELHIENILGCASFFTNIESIEINFASPSYIEQFIQFLEMGGEIESLKIRFEDFDSSLQRLFRILAQSRSLRSFHVESRNGSQRNLVSHQISEIIMNNPNIENLSIQKSGFLEEEALILADALLKNGQKIRKLDLSENRIGDKGAIKIVEALYREISGEELNLSYCDITDYGFKPMSYIFNEFYCPRRLILKGNQIGDSGAIELSKAIIRKIHLVELNLRSNLIGTNGAKSLAYSLVENKYLKSLNLHSNWIGPIGARAISLALTKNKVLEKINLCYCAMSDQGAEEISNGILVNKTVKKIGLRGNGIGNIGASALISALKENNRKAKRELKLLLRYNNFENTYRIGFLKQLRENIVVDC